MSTSGLTSIRVSLPGHPTSKARSLDRSGTHSSSSNESDGLDYAAASGFAHKLRNSLSILVSGSEQLSEFAKETQNADASELAIAVMDAALKQEALITRFLQAYGMNNLDHQAASIEAILQAAVSDLKIQVPRAEIICQGIETARDLAVNRTLLQRAISELLTNAVEGSPDQRVIVRTVRTPKAIRIEIENSVAIRDGQLSVLPTEPFCSSKSGHGGLGLSIAGRSIREIGGTISVREDLGRIEFAITIPFEKMIQATATIERTF